MLSPSECSEIMRGHSFITLCRLCDNHHMGGDGCWPMPCPECSGPPRVAEPTLRGKFGMPLRRA